MESSGNAPLPTLVINTVGEPGSGKTTLSFWLAQALKKHGVLVEFVPEMVKYECFSPQGQARVRSGRFDNRYLSLQARFIRPLMGRVEVLINDGSYELFYFYAKRRMGPVQLARFRERIEALRATAPEGTEHWFVMPRRTHAYETAGRNESEQEAEQVRHEMLACLGQDFRVPVRHVPDDPARLRLLADVVSRVQRAREDRRVREPLLSGGG